MSPSDERSNPFSTRYIRPGALKFLFPPGQSAATLLARLAENGWRGQILGPHGSGKSTLLATLLEALRAAGRKPLAIALHDGERRLPIDLTSPGEFDLVVVDGYEQLGRRARFQLARQCRRHGWGLLVTSHASVGLPTLFETRPDAETLLAVVEQLVPCDRWLFERAEVAALLAEHEGSLREALFALYDLYERRRSGRGD